MPLPPPRNSNAPLIEVPGSALLGNQILHRRSGIISIHVTHPHLYKCLQVHVIANARLVRFVLVRLSPNWPNTNETAVNGRCQQEMWQHTPRFLFHRERVQTRSCLVAEQWTVSKPDAVSQHNRLSLSTGHLNFVSVRHKEDEAVYCEGFVVLSRRICRQHHWLWVLAAPLAWGRQSVFNFV